jgi:endonuclease YncB( thermonuclease family)
MKGRDRTYGRVVVDKATTEPERFAARLVARIVFNAGSRANRALVKAGHAFYVVAVNDLFVRGTPFRFNYSQSASGLP